MQLKATKMAASCIKLVRSSIQGIVLISTRKHCIRTRHVQSMNFLRSQHCVLQHRAFHCSRYPLLQNTVTEEPQGTQNVKNTTDPKKMENEEELEDDGPEYIPKKKAKNPMMIIGYAWIIGLPAGIIGFILAKKQVDKNRLKQLKIRQRMKLSNEGEYERERYKPSAGI